MAAILALGAGVALALRPTSAPAHHVFSLAPIIDGIPCDNETPNYHEHSHLDILNRGKAITVPENTGIHGDTCLYWMHTHDDSGEIHLEAPHLINFTLGKFFDIWHRPLSRRRVASAAVGPGTIMKVWVNFKPYTGDPRAIKLRRHTLVTIEVGPPFKAPQGFDWQGD